MALCRDYQACIGMLNLLIVCRKPHYVLYNFSIMQLLQLLGDRFKGLDAQEVAADDLYESCVVFANVADTSDE